MQQALYAFSVAASKYNVSNGHLGKTGSFADIDYWRQESKLPFDSGILNYKASVAYFFGISEHAQRE
jgi:hypothetical protein